MHYICSNEFENTITRMYESNGVTWLKQLPDIIEQCAQLWSLSNLKPYSNLTYNCVLSGMMHELPIVLKLSYNSKVIEQEVAALHAFNGYGCVNVLEYNANLRAALLAQIIPGDPLASLFPDKDCVATDTAAQLMLMLHKAPITKETSFATLHEMLPVFAKTPEGLAPFIAHARSLREQLLQSQFQQVLLHGDFHQGNILLSDKQWIAIDPAGVIGDPCYDLAVYIRNPLKDLVALPNALEIITKRIERFAVLMKYDKQHIINWTYLQAFTSAYWSIEDNLDPKRHIAFLRLLLEIQ